MNTHLSDEQQVNDYSTIQKSINKTPGYKLSKITFLNLALQSVKIKSECKNKLKNSNKHQYHYSTPPSVYLEEHKGMDWRLQQLGYQIPEQDERLLADNPHLSNELKFLRTQQKLCSIPVKLYINNNATSNNEQVALEETNKSKAAQHNSDVQSNDLASDKQVPVCSRCEQVINKSSYCVQADLGNFNFILSTKTKHHESPVNDHIIYFHIDCLQCITCSEILVDFRAFLDPRTVVQDLKEQNLKIYCSRHFLELFKPRCDLCEELIFDKKCTQAEGKAFHVNHFTCYHCKLPLGGQQYKMADLNQKLNSTIDDDKMKLKDLKVAQKQTKEIHPFCLGCCDKLFGEYCARCEQLITCDQNPVKFEKYYWHATPDCFHCDTCGITLVNSDYLPSSSAKQIFCSTRCAQSLQAKDLNNLNNGLMKLNDRLRNNQHKPTLNSVKEEDYNSLEQDQVDRLVQSSKVEYENSSMFHLASNKSFIKVEKNEQTSQNVHNDQNKSNDEDNFDNCSPSSNRSSNRSLSSLSILFSSSPENTPPTLATNESDEKLKNDEKSFEVTPIKTKNTTNESVVCSTESAKEIKSIDSTKKENEKILTEQNQTSNDADHQRLVPYTIVNNNPFTRTSIIIDNLNTTLSTVQILDDNDESDENLKDKNEQNVQTNQNSGETNSTDNEIIYSTSLKTGLNSSKSESLNDSSNKTLNNTVTSTTSTKLNLISTTSNNNLVFHHPENNTKITSSFNESIQNVPNHNLVKNSSIQPTHYSTLPTRRTERKPFKYEEPSSTKLTNNGAQMNNYYHHHSNQHFLNGFQPQQSTFPVVLTNSSPHSIININSKPVHSMNEVGLPVPNKMNNNLNHFNNHLNSQLNNINLSSFVNCTLPRSNRQQTIQANRSNKLENDYLNGVQSVSISKLNATMLQSTLNRMPNKYVVSNGSSNNISINTSTNSDFSTSSSSTKMNSVLLTNNLNSHSVVVSEDQISEKSNSQLVVKPLLSNSKAALNESNSSSNNSNKNLKNSSIKLPTRQPPLPPVDEQPHGFIKKWSTITSNSSSTNSNQLTDLPVIEEDNLLDSVNQTTSSPSLNSSIQSSNDKDSEHAQQTADRTIVNKNNNNLISMQNFTSSNNSLNMIMQTNLNSSNSASLISATSSINSTISSNGSETTPSQLTKTSLIHNRPDVICFLNPIETMKQLKQKQRELKLKEKMLKKAEQQQSIDLKPKIIEEKLKTNTTNGKNKESKNKSLHHHYDKQNNTRTMSTNNLTEIQQIKLNSSVSNSMSSLNRRCSTTNQIKEQIESTNLPVHRSQPNLFITNQESNGESCSNASTPDHIEQLNQLNQMNHFNQLNKFNQLNHHLNQLKNQSTNPSPSSQYSPTNSVSVANDTDSSSVVNSVEMDNCVQFKNTSLQNGQLIDHCALKKQQQSPHKKRTVLNRIPAQSSPLRDSQLKACESQTILKQKSVSFDPNVIENENNKAPKRLSSRKAMNGHYRYKKKYNGHDELSHRRTKRNSYHNHHYKSSSRRHHFHYEDEDDFCSTCSSCSDSSSVCSSTDEEEEDRRYPCHGRKNQIKHKQMNEKAQPVNKLSQLANVTKMTNSNSKTTTIPTEQMVQIMQQQQLIIQQQLAQMQQQPLKQQRYLKNNTNESCVIS